MKERTPYRVRPIVSPLEVDHAIQTGKRSAATLATVSVQLLLGDNVIAHLHTTREVDSIHQSIIQPSFFPCCTWGRAEAEENNEDRTMENGRGEWDASSLTSQLKETMVLDSLEDQSGPRGQVAQDG